MNEHQWHTTTNPEQMLRGLRECGKFTARKARLFGAAAARRVWHVLTDDRSRRAIEVAERYADGLASEDEVLDAALAACDARLSARQAAPAGTRSEYVRLMDIAWRLSSIPVCVLEVDASRAVYQAWLIARAMKDAGFETAASELLRDLFGNPFRPPPVPNGSAVVQLAQTAYEEWILPEGLLAPDRLAVLADAVEEGGGAHEDLLGHLRQQDLAHVRGCWAVDYLLGKS